MAEERRHAEEAFGGGQELLLQSASAGLPVRLGDHRGSKLTRHGAPKCLKCFLQ